jgi:hypothetical protein
MLRGNHTLANENSSRLSYHLDFKQLPFAFISEGLIRISAWTYVFPTGKHFIVDGEGRELGHWRKRIRSDDFKAGHLKAAHPLS